jgi:hypothetical protein
MPPVFDVATAPAETRQPDPDRAVPPCLGKVLGLVRTLIAYGQNLADMLRQHSAAPHLLPFLPLIVINFGTTDLAPILTRITHGLLRAAALEERLNKRAARGQELTPTPIRLPQGSPHAARPAALPHDPAGDPSLASPPTIEQIIAKDRRRPVGAVLVDICRDLGIAPGQMDRATWDKLHRAVIEYGGNLVGLIFSPGRWKLFEDLISNLNDSPLPTDASGQPIIAFPPWPAPPEQPTPLASLGCEADQDWGRGPGP